MRLGKSTADALTSIAGGATAHAGEYAMDSQG